MPNLLRTLTLIASFVAMAGAFRSLRDLHEMPWDQRGRFVVLEGFLILTVAIQVLHHNQPATWITWCLFVLSVAAVPFTVRKPPSPPGDHDARGN